VIVVASVDLSPLSRTYTVTGKRPILCLNLSILPDHQVTEPFRKISFYLSVTQSSPGLSVDSRNLTYIINDSDSKFFVLLNIKMIHT